MKQKIWLSLLLATSLVLGLGWVAMAAAGEGPFTIYGGGYFGGDSYSDADGNGFSDGTIVGLELRADLRLGQRFDLGFQYDYGKSLDSVASVWAWEGMPEDYVPEEPGTLSNQILSGVLHYRFKSGNGRIGLGYLKYDFNVQETGFEELRVYEGPYFELDFTWPTGPKRSYYGRLKYAPSLTVADWVQGDWDDPDRRAEADYTGTWLDLEGGINWHLSPRWTLTAGITYQLLTGTGEPDPDYRFLDHQYQLIGFTIGMEWRL